MAIMKKFHVCNICLLICAFVCLICYDIYGGLWLKGMTSCWFVLLGLVNLYYARKRQLPNVSVIVLIELGLFFGMCADILLGVRFILGIFSFALGHVLYLFAFYKLKKIGRRDWFIIFPIALISLFVVTGTPYIQIEDSFIKKLLLVYAIIIACMLGKAISNLSFGKSRSRWLFFLGSMLFWFSDVMLAIDMFGNGGRITWILCSYTYWPAQNILAYAMFHFVNEQCE